MSNENRLRVNAMSNTMTIGYNDQLLFCSNQEWSRSTLHETALSCNRVLTQDKIQRFLEYLRWTEKSNATCEKYQRDVCRFLDYSRKQPITKEMVTAWKSDLVGMGYAMTSINSMLASVNSLFLFLGWFDCKVKNIRLQRRIYCAEDEELTKAEYMRMLAMAKGNARLYLILQTICGTGIRVSELQFFTVEAVEKGEITVNCKNKTRTILVPGKLKNILLSYAKQKGIAAGMIFTGEKSKVLNRSVVWRWMKQVCRKAGIQETKAFPHNLRKLFARTYYGKENNIAELADILGHSNINTTRIYIMSTGMEHRRKIEELGLIV